MTLDHEARPRLCDLQRIPSNPGTQSCLRIISIGNLAPEPKFRIRAPCVPSETPSPAASCLEF